ncbi:unnamed protein product [Tuber aestivum]|uniref:Uncharacterized protein n=1 Tax=Tuber aestivum TaxID=59557 RepID=A0A292PJF9_9PEZI|nr:unnamed protein product [Tuber aestivum]
MSRTSFEKSIICTEEAALEWRLSENEWINDWVRRKSHKKSIQHEDSLQVELQSKEEKDSSAVGSQSGLDEVDCQLDSEKELENHDNTSQLNDNLVTDNELSHKQYSDSEMRDCEDISIQGLKSSNKEPERSFLFQLREGTLDQPFKADKKCTPAEFLSEDVTIASDIESEVKMLKELEGTERVLESYKFDLELQIFLKTSNQILMGKTEFEKSILEKNQAIEDRKILANQVLLVEEQNLKTEKTMFPLEEKLQDLKMQVEEQEEEGRRLEQEGKRKREVAVKLEQLIERTNVLVQKM